jgi:hypothetical protein
MYDYVTDSADGIGAYLLPSLTIPKGRRGVSLEFIPTNAATTIGRGLCVAL